MTDQNEAISNLAAPCQQCDLENALNPSRATWLCPVCKRDISLEYYFWKEALRLSNSVRKRIKVQMGKDE